MQILSDLQIRLQQNQELLSGITKRSKLLATLRIISFLAGVVFLVLFINGAPGFVLYLIFASLLAFFTFLVKDKQNDTKKQEAAHLVEIDEEEIRRFQGNFEGLDEGDKYIDPTHPYSQDLDLFGKHSLFQHVNRSSLEGSKDLLANWLTEEAPLEVVHKRQKAIEELKENRPWTLELQAKLRAVRSARAGEISLQEAASRSQILMAIVMACFFGSATLSIIMLGVLEYINTLWIWVAVIINSIVLFGYNLRIQKRAFKTNYLLQTLQVFLAAMEHVKSGTFRAKPLVDAQVLIDQQALRAIKQLKQIVFLLDSRGNLMWFIVNLTLLVDIYSYCLLNIWIRKNGKAFASWTHVIHQFEAFGSCASYWSLHPEFHFPILKGDEEIWQGQTIGHPLIPAEKRITNDFQIGEKINLVTGSNMSGKSTFLRTIGINTVMAWSGLPVCAESLQLSRFIPYTSMRTQDDLSEGASSFYAELKRLQGLFDILQEGGSKTLFLLDEILKGTNSHDRHTGGLGIIERLIDSNSIGFVSTHDLALADHYENEKRIRSLSFNSEMKNNQLVFDYKLHEGKCQSTNASALMKIMNIID